MEEEIILKYDQVANILDENKVVMEINVPLINKNILRIVEIIIKLNKTK